MGRIKVGIFGRMKNGTIGFFRMKEKSRDVVEMSDDVYLALTGLLVDYHDKEAQTHTSDGVEYQKYPPSDEDEQIVEAIKDCQRRFFFLNRRLKRILQRKQL